MTENPTAQIKSLARIAAFAANVGMTLIALVWPTALAISLFEPASFDAILARELAPDGHLALPLTPAIRFAALAVMALPMALGLYALVKARNLFLAFGRGEILTARTGAALSAIGWSVVSLAPVSILSDIVMRVVVTASQPPGSRQIGVGIDDADVLAIVFGLLLVVLGRIQREAARIADELRLFV